MLRDMDNIDLLRAYDLYVMRWMGRVLGTKEREEWSRITNEILRRMGESNAPPSTPGENLS